MITLQFQLTGVVLVAFWTRITAGSIESNIRSTIDPSCNELATPGDVLAQDLTPQVLLEDYLLARRPLVIRNITPNTTLYRILQQDRLMKLHFRHNLIIEAESGLIEDRAKMNDNPEMYLDEFLNRYQTEELYSVSTDKRMQGAPLSQKLELPSSLCFLQQSTSLEVVLWMSRGGTRSVIHTDGQENILFQFAGSKTFRLAATGSYRNLYVKLNATEYYESSCSPVFMDQPDLDRYPNYTQVQYHSVTVHPGDAIYIPTRVFHRVESSQERNVALNVFYTMAENIDELDNDYVDDDDDEGDFLEEDFDGDELDADLQEQWDEYKDECEVGRFLTQEAYKEASMTHCTAEKIANWKHETLKYMLDRSPRASNSYR